MAGDWIKLEHATITKPEVITMADLLGKTPEEVFGMLFHVWCWFDKQSRDGNAGSVTGNALMRFIDHLVRRPGFAACMKKVGWLTDSGMPNFERHNGESAKKRALTNDRVKRSRNAKCNADVTQEALPEKRREEKKKEGGPTPARPDLEFIFSDGLDSLLAGGLNEREARAVLGRMVKDFGEPETAAALAASIGKADVKSYALAILTKRKREAKEQKRFVI